MSNEYDPPPWNPPTPPPPPPPPPPYPPADTGLVLTGDVAALRRQVAELLRDKQALRALLQEAVAAPLVWNRDEERCCHFCGATDPSGRDSAPWALSDHADDCVVVRAHTLLAPPAPTDQLLSDDVATLRHDVTRLRGQLITVTADLEDVEADNDRLRALLDKSRLPHSPDCLTTYNRAYPCSCAARWHNARIDAALGETEHGE